jgi:hypothetical protein
MAKTHKLFYNAPILTGLTIDKNTNIISAQRRKLEDLGINLVYNFKGTKTWS